MMTTVSKAEVMLKRFSHSHFHIFAFASAFRIRIRIPHAVTLATTIVTNAEPSLQVEGCMF